MTAYPAGTYSPRTKENKSGVVYDADKKTVGFVEDVTKLDDEVVAIETELGADASGAYATVKAWLTALTSLLNTHKTRHQNGGADEISVAGLSGLLGDGQTPLAHKTSHSAGGSDALTDKDQQDKHAIVFIIDGGGAEITTGIKGAVVLPFKCEILNIRGVTDQVGSIVVDLWKDSFANYPPTDADSITASATPTISADNKGEDTSLTGWTKTFNQGDVLMFNVDSVSTVEWASITLRIKRIN